MRSPHRYGELRGLRRDFAVSAASVGSHNRAMPMGDLELQPQISVLVSQRLTAPLECEQGLGQASERVVLLADALAKACQLSRGSVRRRRIGVPEEWRVAGVEHRADGNAPSLIR